MFEQPGPDATGQYWGYWGSHVRGSCDVDHCTKFKVQSRVVDYRIYSINSAAFIKFFRDLSAAFIRGRRLFKIQFISCKQYMVTEHLNFQKQKHVLVLV